MSAESIEMIIQRAHAAILRAKTLTTAFARAGDDEGVPAGARQASAAAGTRALAAPAAFERPPQTNAARYPPTDGAPTQIRQWQHDHQRQELQQEQQQEQQGQERLRSEGSAPAAALPESGCLPREARMQVGSMVTTALAPASSAAAAAAHTATAAAETAAAVARRHAASVAAVPPPPAASAPLAAAGDGFDMTGPASMRHGSASGAAEDAPERLDNLVAELLAPSPTRRAAPDGDDNQEDNVGGESNASVIEGDGNVGRGAEGQGDDPTARLRSFLRLQLATSQGILAQLQQQQRRADDLAVRLGQLNPTGRAHLQRLHAAPDLPAMTAPRQQAPSHGAPHERPAATPGSPSQLVSHEEYMHSLMQAQPGGSGDVVPGSRQPSGREALGEDCVRGGAPSRMTLHVPLGDDVHRPLGHLLGADARSGVDEECLDGSDADGCSGGLGSARGADGAFMDAQAERSELCGGEDGAAAAACVGSRLERLSGAGDGDGEARTSAGSDASGDSSGGSSGGGAPLLRVAQRLALLQEQQSSTLQQLLSLRLEQLRLRQQQMSALQELLRAELSVVEGTPLQLSAVQQALALLGQSLDDMALAAAAIHAGRGLDDVAGLALVVSRADGRAEHVTVMARQLLAVLREFPRRGIPPVVGGLESSDGATEAELRALPGVVCCGPPRADVPLQRSEPQQQQHVERQQQQQQQQQQEQQQEHVEQHGPEPGTGVALCVALTGEQCGICLSEFLTGDRLHTVHDAGGRAGDGGCSGGGSCSGRDGAGGAHFFHQACLFEWLRIRGACPTCRLPLRRSAPQGEGAGQEGGVEAAARSPRDDDSMRVDERAGVARGAWGERTFEGASVRVSPGENMHEVLHERPFPRQHQQQDWEQQEQALHQRHNQQD